MARKDKDNAYGSRVAEASPVAQGPFVRRFLIEVKSATSTTISSKPSTSLGRRRPRASALLGSLGCGPPGKAGSRRAVDQLPVLALPRGGDHHSRPSFRALDHARNCCSIAAAVCSSSILGCGSVMTAVWIYAQYSKAISDLVRSRGPGDGGASDAAPGDLPHRGASRWRSISGSAPRVGACRRRGCPAAGSCRGSRCMCLATMSRRDDDRHHQGAAKAGLPELLSPDHR